MRLANSLRSRIDALRLAYRSLGILALCAIAGATVAAARNWAPPKMTWGDPDLEGCGPATIPSACPSNNPGGYGDSRPSPRLDSSSHGFHRQNNLAAYRSEQTHVFRTDGFRFRQVATDQNAGDWRVL
jgi:hypothetical protein